MTMEIASAEFTGIYEIPEAARYLYTDIRIPSVKYNIRSSHLIRWIRYGLADPKLVEVPGRQLLMTFEDLISMRVIAFLRALNYPFTKIKRAEKLLRQLTGHTRPFATEPIWAEKKGAADIFTEIASLLLTASRGGQLAFVDMVKENLINMHGLSFDERGVAYSWMPRESILLHAKIQFGRPCIMGTRIPTNDIAGMVKAGDGLEFLANSYQIDKECIQKALDWEKELATS
ncbi:MAG: DUF433 domain-containing protein [Dehalococcoidia bacterium]|nr:DUF433 domain-containing protein [Dehalococcoidia bacterium]